MISDMVEKAQRSKELGTIEGAAAAAAKTAATGEECHIEQETAFKIFLLWFKWITWIHESIGCFSTMVSLLDVAFTCLAGLLAERGR